MAAPYVSTKRLVNNSLSAMLAAIEMYNKPSSTYREEITAILVVNAWELALKATLRKHKKSIFYKKQKGQPYRSLTLDDSLKQVTRNLLWPTQVDPLGAAANITALSNYRDNAIHLYNAPGLGAVLYSLLQQDVLNYRDFIFSTFARDLADSVTWQLLPLGATAPADAVRFMRVDPNAKMPNEVREFIADLRSAMDKVGLDGGDIGRIATVYDIHLQSVKKMTAADLLVTVSPQGDGQVVTRKIDPNQTHPYSLTELLDRANTKREGRRLTRHDHQVICWKHNLRDDPKYAWKHSNSASYVWSGDAINYFSTLQDAQYDAVRAEYQTYLRETRGATQ